MIRERFILSYAATVLASGVLLSFLQSYSLDIHFSVYVIEFLVLFEFLTHERKTMSQTLGPVAIALFLGLCYVIAQRALQLIGL
jgi:hypothetical protein